MYKIPQKFAFPSNNMKRFIWKKGKCRAVLLLPNITYSFYFYDDRSNTYKDENLQSVENTEKL